MEGASVALGTQKRVRNGFAVGFEQHYSQQAFHAAESVAIYLSMSRKKLPPPSDPLARRLHALRGNGTLEELIAELKRRGAVFPLRTLQSWLAGENRPRGLYREKLREALRLK